MFLQDYSSKYKPDGYHKSFSIFTGEVRVNILNFYEYNLEQFNNTYSFNSKNNLEVVIDITREYFRQHGFKFDEYEDECLMCGS